MVPASDAICIEPQASVTATPQTRVHDVRAQMDSSTDFEDLPGMGKNGLGRW